jgi:glucokinase-like ROK family protein
MPHHQTADQEAIRKVNTSIVLNVLRLHAPISRAELAQKTQLNRSTVTNIVNELLEAGLVLEQDARKSKIGRPSIALVLNPAAGAVVGVEIGVGFISVILTDFVANILWRKWLPVPEGQAQGATIAQVEACIDLALEEAQEKGLGVLGIGLGLPGLVDTHKGELIFAPNLDWENVPLRALLEQHVSLPLYVQNEANMAALGEYYFGAGREVENLIYLSSNVGLGGGLIINGKLYKGRFGLAGEIGHIQRDPQGELCGCGRRGCWETQVGPRAVLQRVQRAIEADPHHLLSPRFSGNHHSLTFDQVVDCALAGDSLCRSALEEVGEYLGAGIADLANIFSPEMVVIGGAFSSGRDILLPVLENTIFTQSLPAIKNDLRIVFSKHGADACVLGAVAIVLDDIIRSAALV